MRQAMWVRVVILGVMVALAGCASTDWSFFGKKEPQAEQRQEDGGTVVGADGARPVEAQPGQPETRVAAAPARSDGRSESIDVRFGFARWDLSEAGRAELLRVVKKLQENPKLMVQLEGYTDSSGDRDKNRQLSQKRVEAVRRFLVEKGVEASRVRAAALGQLPDGGTDEERAKNRRVTVKLTVDTAAR